jgi:glycosyltransferase involved in cell wall biosynthesis
MRIVHLSTSDTSGGAARAAYRLHTGLRRLGQDSTMLVFRRSGNDPTVAAFKPAGDFVSRTRRNRRRKRIHRDFARYRATRPAGFEAFSDDRSETAGQLAGRIPECDVINLHWVAGFLDHESFFASVPRSIPLVWRLADMAPLTGGCHYDFGCGRFAGQCGACPQLGSRDENDLSRQIWRRKNASLALARPSPGGLHIVGTSNWIAAEARKSSLLRDFPISVVPNGLDTEDFAPRDKQFSRQLWGIPADATVVLFAAESLDVRRKGFAELLQSLTGLKGIEKPFLVSVGGLKSDIDVPIPHLNLGRINHDRLLSTAYSAADVFVIPSLQESFGQTVTESLACGTPVVAFASGGIVDMVRPGVTGWLAPTGDTAALRQAIETALGELSASPARRDAMSAQCRRIAVEEYSMDVQARAYLRLYETLVSRLAGRAA